VIHSVLPLAEATDGHALLASSQHIGNILLVTE